MLPLLPQHLLHGGLPINTVTRHCSIMNWKCWRTVNTLPVPKTAYCQWLWLLPIIWIWMRSPPLPISYGVEKGKRLWWWCIPTGHTRIRINTSVSKGARPVLVMATWMPVHLYTMRMECVGRWISVCKVIQLLSRYWPVWVVIFGIWDRTRCVGMYSAWIISIIARSQSMMPVTGWTVRLPWPLPSTLLRNWEPLSIWQK